MEGIRYVREKGKSRQIDRGRGRESIYLVARKMLKKKERIKEEEGRDCSRKLAQSRNSESRSSDKLLAE